MDALARRAQLVIGRLSAPPSRPAMNLITFLFFTPGNMLADALGASDEHERGLIRMLVNSIIWITLGAIGFMIAAFIQL
jgi:hypothetical protein